MYKRQLNTCVRVADGVLDHNLAATPAVVAVAHDEPPIYFGSLPVSAKPIEFLSASANRSITTVKSTSDPS